MRLPSARAPASNIVYEQRSVAGSRPVSAHSRRTRAIRSAASASWASTPAAKDSVFQVSACRTACPSIRGELAATVIGGRGRCTGPGAIRASATA